MNTNNKEAIIQLLIIAKSHNEAGEDVSCSALIEKCIELLQDNEDTEVQNKMTKKAQNTLKESNNLNTSEEHIKDNVINGGSL